MSRTASSHKVPPAQEIEQDTVKHIAARYEMIPVDTGDMLTHHRKASPKQKVTLILEGGSSPKRHPMPPSRIRVILTSRHKERERKNEAGK